MSINSKLTHMKKLFLFALIGALSLFSACSDDKHNDPTPEPTPQPTPVEVIEGFYNTELITNYGDSKDTTEISLSFKPTQGENLLQLITGTSIKNIGTITIDSVSVQEKDGKPYFEVINKKITLNMGECKVNLNGTVVDKEIQLHMTLEGNDKNYTLDFTGIAAKNNIAEIYNLTFNSDIVLLQPELSGKNFTFYIKSDANGEQLKMTPQYKLPKGALINPEAGKVIDFTEAITNGTAIKINVVSEDLSKQITYNLYCKRLADINSSFEKWVKGVEDQEPDMTFYEVANGWSSSNTGAHFLKGFAQQGLFVESEKINYNMIQTTDAQDGQYAAKIVTLNTILKADFQSMSSMVPGITSGTLFLGSFSTDIFNTLNSTKFGVPFFQKPIRFKGYYKYTPGPTYYVKKEAEGKKNWEADNSKTDSPAINAVLYEVSNYDMKDSYYKEALTGVNVFTSPKLVARAELKDNSAHANYTSFDLEFEYKYNKTYDPSKKYMLAIIFASSKDGDQFCGAPGSTLIVDNVEIVTE